MNTKRAVGRPHEPIAVSPVEKVKEALREATAMSVDLPSSPDQDGKLVVATVSWAKDGEEIDAKRFLDSLQRIKRRCHLVLCAGMELVNEPKPCDILQASDGSPVIFESEGGSWRIAFSEGGKDVIRILRTKPEMIDGKYTIPAVAKAFARGEGIVSIKAQGVRMALVICGENNAFARGPGASVFKFGRGKNLPEALKESWILLNPAHRPYRRGSQGGLTKVARVGGRGPTLGKLASSDWRFTDETRLPNAVIYCNNFRHEPSSGDERREYASVVFSRKHIARPRVSTLDDADTRICIRELPLKALT